MLNVLLVGYGRMGVLHYEAINKSEHSKVYGIIDPNININILNNENLKCFKDINEMNLENTEIDCVIIASSTNSHYEIAKILLKNNIPILVEKPLCTNIEEVDELLQIRSIQNSIIRVGFIELYNPVIKFLENLSLDKVTKIIIRRLSKPPESSRGLSDVLYDLTIHDVSILDKLFELDEYTIIEKTLKKTQGLITEAYINFDLNKIKVSLETSINSSKKERIWEIYTNEYIYYIDLLNIKFSKENIETKEITNIKEFDEDTSPIEQQLNNFISCVNTNNDDINHIRTIENSHKFINSLY
ncbi:MAG: hypothetical protein CL869_00460 [Cytophagia bacterium]|nr:hypothetical protein [Cytophagia bacterium]|tara:strand:- start:5103 stop:6002 length:900 start_codon:yes stop_codon:yes gene_type:complete